MKKQKLNRKLKLRKEFITNLDDPSMNQIKGGKNTAGAPIPGSAWATCSIPRAAC